MSKQSGLRFAMGNWLSKLLIQVKQKRQWIFLLDLASPSSTPIEWVHARNATELGVPRCSPDGRHIAYSASDKNYDFFIAQLEDGKIIYQPNTQSYGKIAGYASWKLDSSFIIFTVYEVGGSVVLRAVPDASDPYPLNLGTTASHAAISPDGKQIAFTCDSEKNSEKLCVFDTITNNTQRIYNTNSSVKITDWIEKVTPVWSRDGQWIYFATVDGGDWDIFRIHSDGSDAENITRDWTSNEMMPATR
jgi:Tol biopolymer transport system component